jgi:hypothetical protein
MVGVQQMYALRECAKLSLPKVVQDNIVKLRMKPMFFKPFHKPPSKHHHRPQGSDNWRERALVEMVRRVKEREDPEYADIFSIFNKVVASNVEKLSKDAIERIQKRDDAFRLRVATLLFDKAITQHAYAAVMAECARHIALVIPDLQDDILAQVSMFPTLYNMNETLTYPKSSDSGFDDRVIEWMKQKEKRRGYAKFLMELCMRNLITTECVKGALTDVVSELKELAKQPKTTQTEENVGQFAVFLYECARLAQTHPVLKTFLSAELGGILKMDRALLPSLTMRPRFKLDDAFKCVQ